MFEALAGRKPGYLDYDRYKQYAVVAPFLPETGEFLFQVRAETVKQPGEVSFPGGRIESGEAPAEAAVRETEEELLVDKKTIEVIAPLDVLVAPYHRIVYPFLANLKDYRGTFAKDEVAKVFTVPFEFFLENEPKVYCSEISTAPSGAGFPYHLLGRESYPWARSKYPVLFYQYGGEVIWGMTARFMNNIVTLYKETLGKA